MGGIELVITAIKAGLSVETDGYKLYIQGPQRLNAMACHILDNKQEIILSLTESWLSKVLEQAMSRVDKCFLCKWIIQSAKKKVLHSFEYGLGEFTISQQKQHLSQEYGLLRCEKKCE